MQRFYQLFLQVIYTLHYCHSLGGSVGASYNCHFVLLSPPLVANAQLAIWMSAAAPSTGLRIKDKKLWEKSILPIPIHATQWKGWNQVLCMIYVYV